MLFSEPRHRGNSRTKNMLLWTLAVLSIDIISSHAFVESRFVPSCVGDEAHIEVQLVASEMAEGLKWKLIGHEGAVMWQGSSSGYSKRTKPSLHTFSTCVGTSECGIDGGLTLSISGNGMIDSQAVFINGLEAMSGRVRSGTSTVVSCITSPSLPRSDHSMQEESERGNTTYPSAFISNYIPAPAPLLSSASNDDKAGVGLNPRASIASFDHETNSTFGDMISSLNVGSSQRSLMVNTAVPLMMRVKSPKEDVEWEWMLRDADGTVVYDGFGEGDSFECNEDECAINLLECYSFTYSGESVNFEVFDGIKNHTVAGSHLRKGFFVGEGCLRDICTWKPSLDPFIQKTKRTTDIVKKLAEITGREVLSDRNSPQYQAACWVLYEDPFRIMATDVSLIQRYVIKGMHFSAPSEMSQYFPIRNEFHECDWIEFFGSAYRGVRCNENQVITGISLYGLDMIGPIPSEIFELSHLDYLDISFNDLEGPIPDQLFGLSSLETLRLSENALTGTLSSNFSRLQKLDHIALSKNRLTGTIPEELYETKNLKHIWIEDNGIVGTLSTNVGKLVSLEILRANSNGISGSIPTEIGKCSYLSELSLHNNVLTGQITLTSQSLFAGNIQILDLSGNRLTGSLPTELWKLTNITKLSLNDNILKGKIPPSVGNLSFVETLKLEGNQLTGDVPLSLCEQFEKHQAYHFSTDCAVGAIHQVNCSCCSECHDPFLLDTRHGSCASEEIIVVIERKMGFDPWFDASWSLTDNLNHTIVQGGPYEFVSECLGVDCNAEYTTCASSSACYTFQFIPSKFNPDPPFQIYIRSGRDREEIKPASASIRSFNFGECDSIEFCGRKLYVGSFERRMFDIWTQISGQQLGKQQSEETAQSKAACWIINTDSLKIEMIDSYFLIQRYVVALLFYKTHGNFWFNRDGFLSNDHECDWYGIHCDENKLINGINLADNNLTGYLFRELGQLKFLKFLYLEKNSLGGHIPLEISNLWSMEEMYLGENNFSGDIPEEVGNLGRLKVLDLHDNLISGGMAFLYNLSSLVSLNVSRNKLEGSIESDIGHLLSLEKVDFSSNFFTGTMPLEILNAVNLKKLILSSNEFTGRIPLPQESSDLSQYPESLFQLDLSDNKFDSAIPKSIGNLTGMKNLMLGDNQLTGVIPSQIGGLVNLERVSLSYNQLKGNIPEEFLKLEKLFWIHLHGNELSGIVDISSSAEVFIADCGRPSIAEDPLICASCSICCNSRDQCQLNEHLTDSLSPVDFCWIITGSICTFTILASAILIFAVKMKMVAVSRQNLTALELSGANSVYHFILCNSSAGWLIVLATITSQITMFTAFLRASSFSDKETSDWSYSMRCPSNRIDCDDDKDITWLGYGSFVIIMVSFLLKDLVNGIRLIYKAIAKGSFRCAIAGTALIFVTLFAVLTSYFYNAAIAVTNTDIIANSVILLFMNEIDESLHTAMHSMFPGWVRSMYKEAEDFDLTRDAEAEEHGCRENIYIEGQNESIFSKVEQLTIQVEDLQRNIRDVNSKLREIQNIQSEETSTPEKQVARMEAKQQNNNLELKDMQGR